jgi:transcriptional regulator GlxA family with amidase domain
LQTLRHHGRAASALNPRAQPNARSHSSPVERPVQRIPVYVVLPPRLLLLDVAGPLEVLRRANHVQSGTCFDVHYIGVSSSLRTSISLTVSGIQPLPDLLPQSAWVVLAGDVEEIMCDGSSVPESTKTDGADEKAIIQWLRDAIQPGHMLISICSGALLAGRAGLLDGRACTTHHSCCAELAKLAPKAKVLDNRLYVEDGNCYSSAGITTGVDLMLHLVGKLIGQVSAVAIARYLVVYLRRGGGDPQLSPWLEGRNHLHPAVHRVQDAIAADPTKSWSLSKLARMVGVSNRHMSRLFHEHAGMSFTEYNNRLRVGLARELLSQTRLDMEHIAERAGFSSSRQLRRAWRRLHETAPRYARAGA